MRGNGPSRRLFSRRHPRRAPGAGRALRRLALALAALGLGVAGAWFGLGPDGPAPGERARPAGAEAPPPREVSVPPAEVRVVDGDTLRLGAETVRLAGLDAPERGQVCQRADNTRFDCGEAAARQLAALVARRSVGCTITGRDRYGRLVGICHAEGRDLAEAMVASGWALAVAEGRRGQPRYGMAEAQARSGRQGLWGGRFDTPESWRRNH